MELIFISHCKLRKCFQLLIEDNSLAMFLINLAGFSWENIGLYAHLVFTSAKNRTRVESFIFLHELR